MNDRHTIEAWFQEHGISEVEAVITDMTGVARGKIMPASKYCRELGMRLPEEIFLQTVTGDYPESRDMISPAEIDIVLKPDFNTLRKVPWALEPTAQLIHDAFYADGSPVDMSPRFVLQKVLQLYRERGWQPQVAPELEFFLVKPNPDEDYPLEPPVGRSGRSETGRQSYSIDALNEFDPLFEEVYDYCEAEGIDVDTLIHESGAAQMEINLIHGDPLELADQAFLFKRTLREAARKHNIFATFMAKPMEREPGSAMHIHQSVIDSATGHSVFSDAEGQPSRLFFHHIGGLQRYLPMAMPLLGPNVNSYRRITRYHAAPINVRWGYDNRTAGLRVPIGDPESRRVENRVAGADANPYLAIAASLACGYLGMTGEIEPTEPWAESAYDAPYELPRSLQEAISLLERCEPLCELLGRRFVAAYNAVKECEYEAFQQVISSWERRYLLLNV
ncbi:MAG: glutamine synthetase family protein [Candidatus Competibacterales bacterium]|nr:glutamine synthetase family protein [Candidatus Competibacterales bacterium]